VIPLVVLHLDGTIVGADGQVKQCVWDAVDRARAAGMKFAACTGRPAFGVAQKIATRLGPDNAHIFQSGAQIAYPDGRTLRVTALKEEAVHRLVASSRKVRAVLELYTPSNLFVERKTDLSEKHAKLIGVTAIVRDLEEVASEEPVIRAQWVMRQGVEEAVIAQAPEGLTVATATSPGLPGIAFVNITRGETSKASAVSYLADHLRLPLAHVMAVGDSDNDIPMLEVVGHPRVMADSSATVLARFDKVLPGVEACGVVTAIEQAMKLRAALPESGPS